jgi:micrococcal nuclease
MRVRGLAAAILMLTSAASGEPLPSGLNGGQPAQADRVLDGETVRLADGSELRLAAIMAPKAAPPRAGQASRTDPEIERLSAAAREALARLIDGQSITLHFAGAARTDRHGRHVAYVAGPDGHWVQAALVARGLARVHTSVENNRGAVTLLRLEANARHQRLGLWRHETFRVRKPGELGRWIETFQIVEGSAVTVEGARPPARLALEDGPTRLALNFSTRARGDLRALGDIEGQTLRVRGWVRWQGGPIIDVTHGAQVEQLDAPPAAHAME